MCGLREHVEQPALGTECVQVYRLHVHVYRLHMVWGPCNCVVAMNSCLFRIRVYVVV